MLYAVLVELLYYGDLQDQDLLHQLSPVQVHVKNETPREVLLLNPQTLCERRVLLYQGLMGWYIVTLELTRFVHHTFILLMEDIWHRPKPLNF